MNDKRTRQVPAIFEHSIKREIVTEKKGLGPRVKPKRNRVVGQQRSASFIISGTRDTIISGIIGIHFRGDVFHSTGTSVELEDRILILQDFQVIVKRISGIVSDSVIPPDVIILELEIRQTELGRIGMNNRQVIRNNRRNTGQGKSIGFTERQNHVGLVPEEPQFAISFRPIETEIFHVGITAQGGSGKVCLKSKQIFARSILRIINSVYLFHELRNETIKGSPKILYVYEP